MRRLSRTSLAAVALCVTASVALAATPALGVARAGEAAQAADAGAASLAVTPGDGQAALSWTPVEGATGYRVGRDGTDTRGSGPWSTVDPATATSRAFLHLRNGTSYTLFVEPQGVDSPRVEIAVVPGESPRYPAATSLSVTPGDGQAALSWTPVEGATGYRVGRDGTDTRGSGPWSTVDPATATSRAFLHLRNGTSYTLFVEPQGVDSPRVEIAVTPAAAAPDPTPSPAPTSPPDEPEPDPDPGGVTRSGLPWESGAFTRHSDGDRRAVEQYRGLPLDLVDVHPTRDSWRTILNPWWAEAYRDFDGRFAVAVPLWPRNGSLASTPSYDDEWAAFGRLLVSLGHGDAYVRLGWEFNLPGQYWHATDGTADAWVAAFRRAVAAIRSTAPGVKIVWNPNEGRSLTMSDDRRAWPGAGYVDAVGIDAYDWYQPVRDAASWERERTEPGGWQFWLDFARAQGVKFAVPEWGLYSGSSASGGDNPYYVRTVLAWLHDNRGDVLYESYFNETAPYCGCAVVPESRNPRGAAAYREALRSYAA